MVFKYLKDRCLRSRFSKNNDGNVAVMFGLSATIIIGCMGAAMDFSTFSNAEARSQAIADQTALAAAVFVRSNKREPSPPPPAKEGEEQQPEEGYLDDRYRSYTAAELGYEFRGWVEGGADNVTVTVNYDGTAKEATVKVSGNTVPTFMQIFGNKAMEFESTSVAKYEDYDFLDPATVLMVLDNSGSMSFDDKPLVKLPKGRWIDNNGNYYDSPPDAEPRIDSLQRSASNFIATLQNSVGSQDSKKDKALRTGILAYNENTITSRTVSPYWQTKDTKASIDKMVANGGTNSAPPIDEARIWMGKEDQIHKDMHGKDPLKFLVFMTDGLNTNATVVWVKEDGTGQWRGRVTRCYNGRCKTRWEEVESETKPTYGSNWTEGRFDSKANVDTIKDCTTMKNNGVKIYTIGFALAQGYYDTNEYYGSTQLTYNSSDIRSQAYSFLAACASEPATFLTAENASQLEDAFKKIGNEIQTEIIRLSN